MKAATLFLALLFALSGTTASARVIHVDLEGGGDYETIQEGLDAAAEGDTVLVAPGWYSGPLNRDLDFGGTNVVLVSEAGLHHTIIDCEGMGRGIYFHSGENAASVVDGFRITNGAAPAGAGISCYSYSSPTIRNCLFRANVAWSGGGGMRCSDYASPTLENVIFSANYAVYGGGMIARQYSSPTLTHVVFEHNGADHGGGMRFEASFASLTDVLFYKNEATVSGGGISSDFYARPSLSHVTILKNSASKGGGASWCRAEADLMHCTLAGNSADSGSGVFLREDSYVTISNCIIAFGPQGSATWCEGGGQPAITHCCIFGNAGGDSLCGPHQDNIFADPLFCDMSARDLTVDLASPCLSINNPWGEEIGAWGLGCGGTGVDEEEDACGPEPALAVEGGPNPFGNRTSIRYRLPEPAPSLDLSVYNLKGQRIRTLARGPRAPGAHVEVWDGTDEVGRPVASGVYFCVLTAGDDRARGSILLLR